MPTDDPECAWEEAQALRQRGEHGAALALLLPLQSVFEQRAGFWLVLGDLLEEVHGPGVAVASYRKAVDLAPTNELASRSLFHALWNVGRAGDEEAEAAALAEIRRFTSLAHSDWYDKIVAELHDKMDALWPPDD
jgi:hypothetical protein